MPIKCFSIDDLAVLHHQDFTVKTIRRPLHE